LTLSEQQRRAATLLSRGDSPNTAGNAVGVSGRTVLRWKLIPEFDQLLQRLTQKADSLAVDVTAEAIKEDYELWESRRKNLRQLEWELSELLLTKSKELLQSLELHPRLQNISAAIEVGSNLARRSAELWDDDLNAAISLVRRYGFDVMDRQKLDEGNETDNSND
jgi:hypothetical protein